MIISYWLGTRSPTVITTHKKAGKDPKFILPSPNGQDGIGYDKLLLFWGAGHLADLLFLLLILVEIN